MKRFFITMMLSVIVIGTVFSQEEVETRMDATFYTSTRGEMSASFRPQWQFPFLQGKSPLTSGNNIALKLDAAISPIWLGLTADAELTVFPFLSFKTGGSINTGWNYKLFGALPLVGIGLNKKTSINDSTESDVVGHGLDGVVWDLHFGSMLQFDLAAFVPGDWNHVVAQVYNEIRYFAYTKADGDDFWYFLGDNGLNQNAFNHKFTVFVGYMMPIFFNMVGIQLEGRLPFWNNEIGTDVQDAGYKLDVGLITNFKINKSWSIMAIALMSNGFKDPDKYGFNREWGFDRVQLIATWRIK
jgi:hypothetical protein